MTRVSGRRGEALKRGSRAVGSPLRVYQLLLKSWVTIQMAKQTENTAVNKAATVAMKAIFFSLLVK